MLAPVQIFKTTNATPKNIAKVLSRKLHDKSDVLTGKSLVRRRT